ncbi:MAG TPA: hypothetical protein VG819_13845 [Rhizomicrobium sp.]|jgi:hypothetical protein|nr:hypothetical protein [Rhizomicrobium sp.]
MLRRYAVANAKIRRINQAAADKREELAFNLHADLENLDGEIWELISRSLVDQAQRFQLPLPGSEDWTETGGLAYKHLTPAALAELRSAIRSEQKERWTMRLLWLPILPALTGVLGAVIGLVAILKK